MTLAIGMRCEGGLMIATDTLLSYEGGPTQHVNKMAEGFCTKRSTYVITYSSTDANAATSLAREVKQKLEKADPPNSDVLESAIKSVMQKWYLPVHDERPRLQLLIGASIQGAEGAFLYVCEPPNSVNRIYGPYKAIGEGWTVSDPIYEWFYVGPSSSFEPQRIPQPHVCLCQISYMMYRAKKLYPGWIGGDTDVAFLTEPLTVPYWIDRISMKVAESFGVIFDQHLAKLASMAVGGNAGGTEEILKTAESLYSCSLLYSRAEFRCQFPDKTILRRFYT